ncbi:hypothetical protein ACTQ50_02060 [Blautia sp. Sow4_E7]|uniref:hypothetical protein n=1 Tax=Blautia sp. Sow4_E7 TaxID=3438749 RepID=UPI003F92197D
MRKILRKTAVAVGVGALLLAAPVYGADNISDLMVYTDNIQSDGSLIYYFEEVAVVLPADWKGKIDIVTDGTSATFYHKASHEKWQEKYGEDGGKLFTLSCSVNHDFSELPDFTYIGFSEESVMNYFMVFPTDFQAYTEDESVAQEFQQMNAEIDYVKQHAYMLAEGEKVPVASSEPSDFSISQTSDDGEWVKMKEGFELYLPADWTGAELSDSDQEDETYYAALSGDEKIVLVVTSLDLREDYTEKEIQVALAEENYDSLFDAAKDQIKEQGYTIEKTELINGISCAYISAEDEYGIVFMDKTDSVMELVYLTGENVAEDESALSILHSVKWAE